MEEIIIKGIDEKVYHDRSDNGLDIYMWVNEKVSNYYITYTTRYGALDTEFKLKNSKKVYKVPNGTAHFLEHIKFNTGEGTIANDFYDQYGISINAFTSYKNTSYEVFGNSHFEEALDYLIKYVSTPYFTKDIVEKEKGIICEEVKMGKNNPGSKLYFGTYKALLHKDKRKYLITGEEDEVNSITLEDVQNVFNNYYHPSNMFVIITGNFNPYEASAIIKKRIKEMNFGEYTFPERLKINEPERVVEKEMIIRSNIEIPKVKVCYKIKKDKFKDYDDLLLRIYIGMILRANFGASSDLKEELMEKDLITGMGYARDIIDDYILVYFTVETKYVDEVIKIIQDKYEHMEIDNEMLRRRKRANIASLINDYDDIEYVNSELLDNIIEYGKVIDNAYDLYSNIELSTLQKIIKLMQTDNMAVVKLLPNEEN